MPSRIIVADSEPLFREGLAQLLATQPDFDVVGEAIDTVDAVEQSWREQPDLVLVALDLPTAGGQETARRIRRMSPDVRVIMLVPPLAGEEHGWLDEDVQGVLRCSARATQIFERIRTVTDGLGVHGAALAGATDSPHWCDVPEKLTPREREVLALVARAWSNRQIEGALGIGNSTVKRHVRRILRKLHARNRVQAAVFAYRASYAPPEGVTRS
jgi:two-component system nitrate/nitrite response regulator NarL